MAAAAVTSTELLEADGTYSKTRKIRIPPGLKNKSRSGLSTHTMGTDSSEGAVPTPTPAAAAASSSTSASSKELSHTTIEADKETCEDSLYEKLATIMIMNKTKTKSGPTKKENGSLKELVTTEINQSQSIRLGIYIENIIRELITKERKDIVNIKEKNKKGIKEKDHLFMNEPLSLIIYAEFKANINLDSEKCPATINKINTIEKELLDKYPGYSIKKALVCLRYLRKTDIPTVLLNKYKSIHEHLYGVNDYLELFGITTLFDYASYRLFINTAVSYL
jgi:hypothetical protein